MTLYVPKGLWLTFFIGSGLIIGAMIFFMKKRIVADVHRKTELTFKHIQNGLKTRDYCSPYCSKKNTPSQDSPKECSTNW